MSPARSMLLASTFAVDSASEPASAGSDTRIALAAPIANAVRRPDTSSFGAIEMRVTSPPPAATAAAITGVARGLRGVCVDKARFPRDKTCGDGLTANALRLLEALGVSAGDLAGTEPVFVRETVLVSPSGHRARLPLPTAGA